MRGSDTLGNVVGKSSGDSTVVPAQSDGISSSKSSDCARRLTTAESLVLEVVVAHRLLGAPFSVLSSSHWVRPQLDALADLGLISWDFDSEANFVIRAAPAILRHPA